MSKINQDNYYYETDRITDGYDIFFWVFDEKSNFAAPHWHSAIEISYVMDGSIDVMLPNYAVTLHPGDINLVDSTVIHSVKSIYGNKAILIQLPYPLLERYIPDFDSFLFFFDCHAADAESVKKRSALIQTIKEMQFVFEQQPKNGNLKFNSLVFDLLYQLCNNFAHPKQASRRALDGKHFDRIKAVMKYTSEHYKEQITLSEIATVAAFQEEYFCRFFKKNVGITYFQYLNELRMSHIHQDLITTDLPLKTILDKHGFTNYKVFRRLFFEEYHTTPGQYRKDYARLV